MPKSDRDLNQLNDQLSHHLQIILKCTVTSKKYGRMKEIEFFMVKISNTVS